MAKPFDVIFPFLGAGVGGSHVVAFRLASHLKQFFRLESLVLCVEGSRIAEEAAKYGIAVASTGERAISRNNPFYDLTRFAPRLQLLKRYGGASTIVHTSDIETTQSWGPCAKVAGMKLVYQHQSLNRAVIPNRIALWFPDGFIAVSDPCVENLHYVDQRRITKVPYSMNAPSERVGARDAVLRDAGLSADVLLVGFVGNFWERKRPRYFIDAARHIAAAEPRARFLMFGRDGDHSEAAMKAYAAEAGLADRVVFMGFRSPPEENIAALDLLLAPAVREPFGLTPVEALLHCTPYVMTADAGHEESGRRWGGGVLVQKDAPPEEFAAVALTILRGEVNPVLPPSRRAEIAEELSPRAQAATVMGIYRKLVAGAVGERP